MPAQPDQTRHERQGMTTAVAVGPSEAVVLTDHDPFRGEALASQARGRRLDPVGRRRPGRPETRSPAGGRCKVRLVVESNCDLHQLLRDKMHGSQRGRGRWSASSSPLARVHLRVRRLVAALLASGEHIIEVLAELIEQLHGS